MKKSDLLQICDRSDDLRLLCVGDVMLDQFVYGSVDRISPEAPIPVMRQSRTMTMLGAAGNVARNVASLGATAVMIGPIGEDEQGNLLIESLSRETRIEGQTCRFPTRRTTLKTRFVANSQQLLRVDSEDLHALTEEEEIRICQQIHHFGHSCDAILLSDYAKGAVTAAVIDACLSLAKTRHIPLIVDPKGIDFAKYGEADVIKPNAKELSVATGLPTKTDEDVEAALFALMDATQAKAILVTRSEKGLSYLHRNGQVQHVPTISREVFDVSGAGDTSMAALGLGLAAGVDLSAAAQFALSASGIAVGKMGTAAVTADEIRVDIARQATRQTDLSHVDEAAALAKVEEWHAKGLKVGFTNGCFDILHAGHLSVLEFAASHCDRLIVGLNSDASIRRLKGETRPINSVEDRRVLLEGLKAVDAVIVFDEDTPAELIERVRPAVLVKGGDYDPDTLVGSEFVRNLGGEVLIAPLLDGRSTTNIIERSKS